MAGHTRDSQTPPTAQEPCPPDRSRGDQDERDIEGIFRACRDLDALRALEKRLFEASRALDRPASSRLRGILQVQAEETAMAVRVALRALQELRDPDLKLPMTSLKAWLDYGFQKPAEKLEVSEYTPQLDWIKAADMLDQCRLAKQKITPGVLAEVLSECAEEPE